VSNSQQQWPFMCRHEWVRCCALSSVCDEFAN
jgi:hypothetical protein